jgi:predicted histidine transporter YuiF (NhaC family)
MALCVLMTMAYGLFSMLLLNTLFQQISLQLITTTTIQNKQNNAKQNKTTTMALCVLMMMACGLFSMLLLNTTNNNDNIQNNAKYNTKWRKTKQNNAKQNKNCKPNKQQR